MNRKQYLLIILIITTLSCSTSKKTLYKPTTLPQGNLVVLGNNNSSIISKDTLKGEVTQQYLNTSLKQIIKDKIFQILKNDTIVFCGNYKTNDYLFELWNNTHLIISINNKEFPAYGADGTKRDSLFILDLGTHRISYTSLKSIYLTRNASFLMDIPKEYDYYIIQDIDLGNNIMTLINKEFITKTFHLYTIDKPCL
jgi:hypothetical protein